MLGRRWGQDGPELFERDYERQQEPVLSSLGPTRHCLSLFNPHPSMNRKPVSGAPRSYQYRHVRGSRAPVRMSCSAQRAEPIARWPNTILGWDAVRHGQRTCSIAASSTIKRTRSNQFSTFADLLLFSRSTVLPTSSACCHLGL